MGNAKRDPERECYPLVSSGVSRGSGGKCALPAMLCAGGDPLRSGSPDSSVRSSSFFREPRLINPLLNCNPHCAFIGSS